MLLFLIGCIGTRTLLAVLAKNISPDYLPLMGVGGLAISFGLMYFYLSGTRTTGPETFGDKIWWNHLRPVHSTLYLLFAILAFQKSKYAWVPLAIDVCIGIVAFLNFHRNELYTFGHLKRRL